ncbi:MAG: helix-turn-helix transcriptional regulator [Solirubrobacterales bacterium]|nr:helix-turn-helix transcriptional regulator [Solirubrobacterales bacterium]MBV9362789.1 helix-turn-helix transcriptional regulator [Solirubrobacterales bacterium]MBV9683025.1 helix-turn-helix transcriptional regulator [Solirubrobacterales bacterium]MBV9811095.1 helix-turn-helix transcriptional regulator [Solirubrobacterales bacterium]
MRKSRTIRTAAANLNGTGDSRLAGLMGQRIRRLRTQAGKTLRAQAREIGIAASSLSALENGQGGVSLKRLQLVAEHFGLHITELLGEPAVAARVDGVEIIRNCAATVPGVQRGTGVLYQLLGSGRDHIIQPYLLSFDPEGGYDRDMIGHPGEEIAYVLHGRVELLIEDECHALTQGDLIRFRADRPHAFRNASSVGVAAVIGAATPPW